MANTSFKGPVRSENGFNAISRNATTGAVTETAVLSGGAGSHVQIKSGDSNSDLAGNTVRINNLTNTGTANSLIGFQSKPGQGADTAQNVIGFEVSPRLSDGVDLTGSASIIGGHIDVYLKGTTGNIAGDVRGLQSELVDDGSSSRTISGYVSHLRVRSNLSATVTGKYSVLRVENEEGTKAMDGLIQFTTGSGCLVEGSGGVGGTQDRALKVLVGSTTYYIPMHTSVS